MTEIAGFAGRHDGLPVYAYPRDRFRAPVSVLALGPGGPPVRRPHVHEFPVLVCQPDTGLVDVVAAGRPVDPDRAGHRDGAVAVFFDPSALGEGARSPWPTWRAHPLLFPFLHGHRDGVLRLEVPASRRSFWRAGLAALQTELTERRDGYAQAALAHLTVLLIDLARISDDVAGDLRRSNEPVLAQVFDVIERRLGEPLSLRDVARDCGLTPGYLTTLVRCRTGRTVGEWITERRMAEARTLLLGTELTVAEVGRRVGMTDAGYFTRQFRRRHGASPRAWRIRTG
ncbi:AraC family transcriptional regulator [Mycobacterium sp. NAZ190054]|uniref:helix-turn-helix domain-containing protein n=1 Tax=Mycobacterium sp. NAZ190054 TaxID=1747766 RepID=UPI00079BF6DA|nr:AraC family transcriptional regulator [Mycobacterium sp. NAZ190054]KWX68318.1 AraC family transcriptional regulator [Mycobacterium sp. NAZ190054]